MINIDALNFHGQQTCTSNFLYLFHTVGIFLFVIWVRAGSSWEWLRLSRSAVPRRSSPFLFVGTVLHTPPFVWLPHKHVCPRSRIPAFQPQWSAQDWSTTQTRRACGILSSWVEGYNLRYGWLFCHEDWIIEMVLIPHPVCFWVSNALLPWGSRRHCIFLQQISSFKHFILSRVGFHSRQIRAWTNTEIGLSYLQNPFSFTREQGS